MIRLQRGTLSKTCKNRSARCVTCGTSFIPALTLTPFPSASKLENSRRPDSYLHTHVWFLVAAVNRTLWLLRSRRRRDIWPCFWRRAQRPFRLLSRDVWTLGTVRGMVFLLASLMLTYTGKEDRGSASNDWSTQLFQSKVKMVCVRVCFLKSVRFNARECLCDGYVARSLTENTLENE